MSIMAKTPSGYKKIGSAYLGERPVDKVFNANGDVVYALQRELTGVPPLLFKGKEQSELLNYRICGDTVDGNSVGDLVESGEHAGEYKVPVTVEGKNLLNFDEPNVKGYGFEKQSEGVYYIADTGYLYNTNRYKLDTETGKQYVLKGVIDNTEIIAQLSGYLEGTENPVEGQIFKTGNINTIFTANGKTTLTIFGSKSNQSGTVTNLQVYDISITDDTYEPYQAPVTTIIYLPEQIRKVGDEAEYIDYGEQKQHRVRKNLLQNKATSQTINGVTFTVNSDGSVTLSGQLTSNKADLYLAATDSIVLPSGEYYVSCKNAATKYYFILGGSSSTGQIPYTEIVNDNDIKVICRGGGIGYCLIRVVSDVDTPVILYPMIRLASIEDDTYEPYIENTDLDVTLPALPTLKGTNVLSVDTEVQPSRMDIKGRIKSLT